MSQTVGDRALDKLKELIGAEEARITEIITGAGAHMVPIDAHRYWVGQVHGLRVATDFIADAIRAVSDEGASDRQKVAA